MDYFINFNFHISILFVLFSSVPLTISFQSPPEDGQCVMYDLCEGEQDEVPCVYSGPPKPMDNRIVPAANMTAVPLLKAMCPDFVHDDNPHVCCSYYQLQDFHQQMVLTEQTGFARCQSCMQNFRRLFCHFYCSPVQSRFVHIIRNFTNDDDKVIVEEASYYVSKQYADTFYNACRDVQDIYPGTYVMDLVCGSSYGSAHCNGEHWAEFMGNTPEEGGYSPFKINYIITSKEIIPTESGLTFYPMNGTATQCSESPGEGYERCSCSDCRDSCSVERVTAPPLDPVPEPFEISMYDEPSVTAAVVLNTISLILFSY